MDSMDSNDSAYGSQGLAQSNLGLGIVLPNELLENDLDISWIDTHEKEINIENVLLREPVEELELCFIYVNNKGAIEYVKKDLQPLIMTSLSTTDLEEVKIGKCLIPKERVLYLIQKNKWNDNILNHSKKKYKLNELLLYYVDLDPENIQSYSKSEDFYSLSKDFLKPLPFFNDVVIPDSVCIFHSIHCLYFLFTEIDKEEIKKVIKPILKKTDKTKKVMENLGDGEDVAHNVTKKVGFSDVIEYSEHKKRHSHGTRKKK